MITKEEFLKEPSIHLRKAGLSDVVQHTKGLKTVFFEYCPIERSLILAVDGELIRSKPDKVKELIAKHNLQPDSESLAMARADFVYFRDRYHQECNRHFDYISQNRFSNMMTIYFDLEKRQFIIKFGWSERLRDLFDNKLGNLSFVTEYDPTIQSRVTTNPFLIDEIIRKATPLVKGMHVFGLEYVKKWIKRQYYKEAFPLPKVSKLLSKGMSLYPLQNVIVRSKINLKGDLINGSDIGVGKTVCTLAYLVETEQTALVVCPKIITAVWLEESKKFFGDYFGAVILNKDNCDTSFKNSKLIITHYEFYRTNYRQIPMKDCLVLDESHRIKNKKAQITQAIMVSRDKFADHICLSGTFVRNDKRDAYTQLNFCRKGYVDWDEITYMTIGGFWNKIVKDIYVRRSRAEMQSDIKPKTVRQVKVDYDKKIDKIQVDDIGDLAKVRVALSVDMVSKTVDLAKEILEGSDDSIFITTEFIKSAEAIYKALGSVACLNHGELKFEERTRMMNEFKNNPKKRVFVATRPSVAEGITIVKANHIIQNDLPSNPPQIDQIEGRVYRTGQDKPVYSYWMTTDQIFCQSLLDILADKYIICNALNEGKQISQDQIKTLNDTSTLGEILKRMKAKQGKKC